jgi:phage anti-repressor protein
MDDLIKLEHDTVGGELVQTVDGRQLHKFLGVRERFNGWITRRVDEYSFLEGVDFVTSEGSGRGFTENSVKPSGGRPRKDYHLTLDMAKELSMVERTPKGREARRYFIECERIARGHLTTDATDEISSPLERLPLYLGVVRLVMLRRLMFSTAYQNVSLRVGVLHFRDMTKRNVLIADGFIRRVEAGNATSEDFRTITHNRARLLGPDSQLKLIED